MKQVSNDVRPAYKPREAAALMRFHVGTVYKMLADGRLKGVRMGRIYRIPASELDPYLQKQDSQAEYEYADHVRRVVDRFPPLTTEQRARIAILLRGGTPPLAEPGRSDDIAA